MSKVQDSTDDEIDLLAVVCPSRIPDFKLEKTLDSHLPAFISHLAPIQNHSVSTWPSLHDGSQPLVPQDLPLAFHNRRAVG